MLIQELTDDVIRNDPLFLTVIERNRALLEEMGWQDASLVEQYNIVRTILGDCEAFHV